MWQQRSGLYGSIFSASKSKVARILNKSAIYKHISALRPVVIYTTVDDEEEEESLTRIEEIFEGFGIPSQRKVASSDLLNDFRAVGFVSRPRVFFRGRYIGGREEVVSLRSAGGLEASAGVCAGCGGHKFKLASTGNIIPCTACAGSAGYQRINDSRIAQGSHTKLFICFQGKNSRQRDIYVICSLDAQQPFQHSITTEAVISGPPFMGFGVYDSKIVLAGGENVEDNTRHNGCITFDMKTHRVDYKPFPVLMTYGKFKPLVFQLGKRLYVCDSQYDATSISPIEWYSPAVKTEWHGMEYLFTMYKLSRRKVLANYSCLVFGNSCLISVPPFTYYTSKTHCNYVWNSWTSYSDTPLPFTGVATFHAQDGFDDFVMIYFDKGAVRVCKFDLSSHGESQELFAPHKPDENVRGYFADFGGGCFCLTTFDKFRVYVCTFVVTREGNPSDPLRVTHSIQSNHNFFYDKLFSDDMKITSVVGCSVATQNEDAKSRVEKAESIYYKAYRKMEDDYDPLEIADPERNFVLEDPEHYSEREEEMLASDYEY